MIGLTGFPDRTYVISVQGSGADRLAWRTSSFSGGGGGACVEVAPLPGRPSAGGGPALAVRDSKNRTGGTLAFAAGPWTSFVDGVRAGRLPGA